MTRNRIFAVCFTSALPITFTVSLTANFPQSWTCMVCWLCYCWLDIWYLSKAQRDPINGKTSSSNNGNISSCLPPLLLWQWTNACQRGSVIPSKLARHWLSWFLSSGFTCVFLVLTVAAAWSGLLVWSLLRSFAGAPGLNVLGGIRLSVDPVVATVLAAGDHSVVKLWLSDVQGFSEPVSGTVLSALTHSSVCHTQTSDRSFHWSKAESTILFSFQLSKFQLN